MATEKVINILVAVFLSMFLCGINQMSVTASSEPQTHTMNSEQTSYNASELVVPAIDGKIEAKPSEPNLKIPLASVNASITQMPDPTGAEKKQENIIIKWVLLGSDKYEYYIANVYFLCLIKIYSSYSKW